VCGGGNRDRRPAFFVLLVGFVAGLALLATSASAGPSDLRDEADRLGDASEQLGTRESAALLELFALESRLRRLERRSVSLERRLAELVELRDAAERQLLVVRTSSSNAQQALADRVVALYVGGTPTPLEIILGSSSVDELVDAVDAVERLAEHDSQLIAALRESRKELSTARKQLVDSSAEVEELLVTAREEGERARQARDEQASYIATLREQQALNNAQIDALLVRAAAAEQTAAELASESAEATVIQPEPQPQPEAATEEPSPATQPANSAGPGRRVTVSATMYCLRGTTATGISVAPGVVAVDPSFIPLGTRMHIPGYGPGVAADTGGAVIGWTIDMWVASCDRALAFGRRSVTITIYD
jgi:cystine transport system substrate-binding protein